MATRFHRFRDPSVRAAVALAFWLAPAQAFAAEEIPMPPERPTTAYEAKIRNTFSIVEPGGGSSGGDTLEVHVSGSKLYEDAQILDTKTVIVDIDKREVIEFDPKAEDKVAARFPLNEAPIPYISGRTGLAAFDAEWPAPKIAGKDKVAGEKCTILHYGNPAEDGIAACVSNQGVVMRAKIVFPDFEREFEVLDFDAGKQDEKYFAPPKDFKVVDAE